MESAGSASPPRHYVSLFLVSPAFLQFFDAYFRGSREEVELTVNANYSGT